MKMIIHVGICAACAVLLSACAAGPNTMPSTYSEVLASMDAAALRPAPKPATAEVLRALLPPLAEATKSALRDDEPRFDLKVSELPAPQVLNAIVNDTRYSMVVHPGIKDAVSLNLKQVTLQEVLESLRGLYGYEYRVERSVIHVLPAGMQTRLYQIDYLASQRAGSSEIRVSANGLTDAGAGQAGALQSTSMQTLSSNNFWGEMRAVLGGLLGCVAGQTGATQAPAATVGQSPLTRAALRAEQQLYGALSCPDGHSLMVSPQSGVVMVRALPGTLRSVSSYLNATQKAVERQVLIEAKVLEVALRDGYETGVNWASFFHSGQIGAGQLMPGASLGTAGTNALLQSGALTAGAAASATAAQQSLSAGGKVLSAGAAAAGSMFAVAVQTANFAALMSFLQTQGVVHTLSSPRIATMNNQKAVLKVGSDALYVTRVTGGSVTAATGGLAPTVTSPTFEVQSFFSGIALDVTPQIGADGNILLHVRPSISDVSQRVQNLNLGNLGSFALPLVTNSISETDSVIRAQDGQVVALGGLMRSAQSETRGQVPGAGDTPFFGALFRNTAQSSEKRELVILLKPTIVETDGAWAREVGQTGERLKALDRGYSWGGRAEVFGVDAENQRR